MSKKCSDNNNECKYESIGTLSYRASCKTSLSFIPDQSHLLEYSANSYAVFVAPLPPGSSGDKKADREALAVRLRDDDGSITLKKSVPINVPCVPCNEKDLKDNLLQVARLAAEKQTTVTLTVTRSGDCFELAGITLPAR